MKRMLKPTLLIALTSVAVTSCNTDPVIGGNDSVAVLPSPTENSTAAPGWVTATTWSKNVQATSVNGYLWPPVSFCALMDLKGPVGHFRVVSMITKMESRQGVTLPFTYVTLEVLDGIRQLRTGDEMIVRMSGGPMPDGAVTGSPVATRVGEDFVAFLDTATFNNNGYYGLLNVGTFQAGADGDYTNGQLFVAAKRSATGLKRDIRDRLTRCDARNDLKPDVQQLTKPPT